MFACLYLPDLPAEAALIQQPDLRAHPCAVVADEGRPGDPKAPLLAVNSIAAQRGIRAGESSIRARVQCPALRFLTRNPDVEHLLQSTLLALAESLAPDFECTGADTFLIDLAGARPPGTWNPPLQRLRLALAETPDLAHLAAMVESPFSGKALTLADFDPLPLEILPMADAPGCTSFLPVLRLWGLRTLGDFRHLPRQDIAERLGGEAIRWHDILHAKNRRLLRLHRSVESYVQIVHFEFPVESLESLIFQANRMLQTLCARLESSHRAAGGIRFELTLESNDRVGRKVNLPEPLASPAALLRTLHVVFEALQLPSAIMDLELELEPVRRLAAQREWLGRQLPQPGRWPDTLARLEALLGPGRIGIPQPEDSHRPDAFRLLPASGGTTVTRAGRTFMAAPLPLRRFRPPLEVAVAGTGQGFHLRPQALLTGPHAGLISKLRGPFPFSGDWWNPETAWRRVDWDIGMESGHLLRLVHLPAGRWQLDGAYA
jgi:protein ImuB